ncbi:MAG: threonine synthase [Bacteroidia bacterium]|nr:threonine synthase [Bacteroidia bacterium]
MYNNNINHNSQSALPSLVERGKGRGFYSTNHSAPPASLQQAVVKGLAPDRGLYMPEKITQLDPQFFDQIGQFGLIEIAQKVARNFFGEDIPQEKLDEIVADTLNFDIPLVQVEDGIYVLELFHGPTFAFKDVGARFMARMLSYFVQEQEQNDVKVLVATSGDTGSAVANGFLGVKGIRVFVLYPSGKVSDIQEAQFTTLGQNIVALEIDGTFDDCQALVKAAFSDDELNAQMNLTSANSINVARFLPQSFYYFYAYAQLAKQHLAGNVVISVPSGNLGNLTAGLFAKRMGLPVKRFIAANNRNDVFREYLASGNYTPRASVQTVANAMDVGAPSNFDRILALYKHSHHSIAQDISAYRYTDQEIKWAIKQVYEKSNYLLDPHGACAYMALKESKTSDETGIFLATAHPAKFKETVEECIGKPIEIPAGLAAFMQREKQSFPVSNNFFQFKKALINLS